MMRKVVFLVGVSVGYVMGARTGRPQQEAPGESVSDTSAREDAPADPAAWAGTPNGSATSRPHSNVPPRGTFSPVRGIF